MSFNLLMEDGGKILTEGGDGLLVLGIGYKEYQKGDYVGLPTGDAVLETPYSDPEYIAVSVEDEVYTTQTAAGKYTIHQFKDFASPIINRCHLRLVARSSQSLIESPVYLQIYNRNTTLWENVASNNSSEANTEFTLEANIPNLTNYKDIDTMVSFRTYQLML